MKQIVCIFMLYLFSFHGVAHSHEFPSTLSIARQENYPPYIYENKGKVVGLCAELAEAAFSLMGISVTYTEYPFARMLKKAEWGHVDAVMMVFKTEEREQYLYYPENSLFYEHNSFFSKKDSLITYSGNIEDLKDHTIGVVLGFSYGSLFDSANYIEKEVASNHELLLRQLRGNRFNVGLGNKHVVNYYAEMIGFEDDITFLEPNLFNKEPLYIAFTKKKPGYDELSAKFSQALEAIKESGQYHEILAKYHIK